MSTDINLGQISAGFIQFILFMGLLQPAVLLVTPASFQNTYFGLVNQTSSNLKGNVINQVQLQANGTSGFSAASLTSLQSFGGLAFYYAAFGAFIKSIQNFPNMLWMIFVGSTQYFPYAVLAAVSLLSITVLGYFGLLGVYKGISLIMKASVEEM
jgi:hypothetical protein